MKGKKNLTQLETGKNVHVATQQTGTEGGSNKIQVRQIKLNSGAEKTTKRAQKRLGRRK